MLRLFHSRNCSPKQGQANAAVDEQALLDRIIQGDPLAFEIFYDVYYPKLFRFILGMTHSAEVVKELIQETLLVVWEKPDNFNHNSKISTWVFGIAYHKALKSIYQNNRQNNSLDIDSMVEIINDPSANQAQTYEYEDWMKCALAILPPDQRSVIELSFCYDLPYQDIAKILDCPENTVKTRMFHARKKLQAFMEAQDQAGLE